jgi:hypothetical protein
MGMSGDYWDIVVMLFCLVAYCEKTGYDEEEVDLESIGKYGSDWL